MYKLEMYEQAIKGRGGWVRKEQMFQRKCTSCNLNGDGSSTNMESARVCGYQLGARTIVISDASVMHDNSRRTK